MDWHNHFEQIFFTTWHKAGLPDHEDFKIENIETKEFGNFNNDWIIDAPNIPPGLQTYQLQSVYGFGVMLGVMFSRMLGLDTKQTKHASDWCGRFNLGISLFDYICDELEGVNSVTSLQVFQPFTKINYSDKHSLTPAEELLSKLAGGVLNDLKKVAKEREGFYKTDPLFKLMKQLFEAQDFVSKTGLSADADLPKIKKALYSKSAEPFRLMAEYTACMADANNPLLLENARCIGKAVGYCYWIIDDAKDVWCDLEAGQWNLFLQLAASEDPLVFAKDRDAFTKSRLMHILEHSNHAQKISTQIIKKLVDAKLQLGLSKKVEHETMGLISASLWQWFHY